VLERYISINKERIRYRFEKFVTFIVFRFHFEDHLTQVRRDIIGKKVYVNYSGTVAFGNFRGVKLNGKSKWSGFRDAGSKILGLYEQQVIGWITNQPRKFELFVDVGASDGFYAIALLKCNKIDHAITFEISADDRKICESMSKSNSVFDKISIEGRVQQEELMNLLRTPMHTLVLVDIEGEEFKLINLDLLETAKNHSIIIEVHAMEKTEEFDKFYKLCQSFHKCEILTSAERSFPEDEFTSGLTDNERALLLSEGRPFNMHWFALTPRSR
jgi:hypothetical protein